MYTTTDQPATSLEVAATDGRMRTTPFGTAYVRGIPSRRWRSAMERRRVRAPIAGLAIGALLAGTSLTASDDRTDPTTAGGSALVATELDVRGVPLWWSEGPSAGGAPVATELDVRGVPVWWSEGRASEGST